MNSFERSSPTCSLAVSRPEVLVVAGRARVVVAGADVAVAAQAVHFLADHEGELAVGLQTHDAVDHMDAGLFQFPGPGDVGLLVEAGLDLHEGQDLLAGLGGVDQGIDNRGVARTCGTGSA